MESLILEKFVMIPTMSVMTDVLIAKLMAAGLAKDPQQLAIYVQILF